VSDSTEVGSIVAYLVLRREDWTAGVRSTEQDARRLGALNPRIRIDANTGEILAQLGLVHAAERKVGTEAARRSRSSSTCGPRSPLSRRPPCRSPRSPAARCSACCP
jgi:hypothetical protein